MARESCRWNSRACVCVRASAGVIRASSSCDRAWFACDPLMMTVMTMMTLTCPDCQATVRGHRGRGEGRHYWLAATAISVNHQTPTRRGFHRMGVTKPFSLLRRMAKSVEGLLTFCACAVAVINKSSLLPMITCICVYSIPKLSSAHVPAIPSHHFGVFKFYRIRDQ